MVGDARPTTSRRLAFPIAGAFRGISETRGVAAVFRFRFRLRTFMILVVVFAICLLPFVLWYRLYRVYGPGGLLEQEHRRSLSR